MLKYYCDTYKVNGEIRPHLVCLPYSIVNLHIMANALGIRPCWFHKDHYDIPKRRVREIMAQCTIVDTRHIVSIRNGNVMQIDHVVDKGDGRKEIHVVIPPKK